MLPRYAFEQNRSVGGKVRDSDSALRYADASCTGLNQKNLKTRNSAGTRK